MTVYAVTRGTQVLSLHRTEESASSQAAYLNDLFKRGKRAVVVSMSVLD